MRVFPCFYHVYFFGNYETVRPGGHPGGRGRNWSFVGVTGVAFNVFFVFFFAFSFSFFSCFGACYDFDFDFATY